MSARKKWRGTAYCSMFATLGILLVVAGCGPAPSSISQNQKTTVNTSQTTPIFTPTPTPLPTSVPTPLPSPTALPSPNPAGLQGPTNFQLTNTLNFSSASGTGTVNGAETQLSESAVEQGVTKNLQHTLFMVDGQNNITVSTSTSTSPIQASASQNADGSTAIAYTEPLKSGSISFSGVLTGTRMRATYSGQSLSATRVNNQNFSGGTRYTATFTTVVTWVSSDQIPNPPTNGQYQRTSAGGVILSWISGGSSQKYNIYRFILTDSRGFLPIGSSSETTYTDESPEARSNASTITGIAYAIYAVGSTGIENPKSLVISVSSLG